MTAARPNTKPLMDFSRSPSAALSVDINATIDAALMRQSAEQAPRPYLGGSRLGVECLRALGYEWFDLKEQAAAHRAWMAARQSPSEPWSQEAAVAYGYTGPGQGRFSAKSLRRFRLGHMQEDETVAWMHMAGFEMHVKRQDGGQFGFGVAKDPETGEARLRGHIDGCITAGPVALPYPLLFEHKIMKAKKWDEFAKKGLAKANPVYWGQVHTYMGYMELAHCLFAAWNSDTSDIHFELIPFDPQVAQRMTDRGLVVLSARQAEDLPRITNDPTDFRCSFCDWRERCFAAGRSGVTPTAPTPKPVWLSVPQPGAVATQPQKIPVA